MKTLTLSNPIKSVTASAVDLKTRTLGLSAKSLSTGQEANNDLVSTFIGTKLGDSSFLQGKVLGQMGYSVNALNIAGDSIGSISSSLTEMLGIITQAENASDANRINLNQLLQDKMEMVAIRTREAQFDNRKLLTGDFGDNVTVRTNYNTKTVNVRQQGTGSNGNFAADGAKDQKTLDFTTYNTLKEGDTIHLHNIKFTMVGGEPKSENEVTIGKTPIETASNLTTAIRNNSSEVLRAYNVEALNGLTVITQRSASASPIPLIVPASVDASSNPSTYSFEFLKAATAGSHVIIAGETFTFGNGAGEVSPGITYQNSGKNLLDAIEANPNLKAFIDDGSLKVSANNWGVISIRSTLSRKNLGFNYNFPNGDLRRNNITVSGATSYGKSITFNTPPAIGDQVTIAGVTFTFDGSFLNNSGGGVDNDPADTNVTINDQRGNPDLQCAAINLNNKILTHQTTAALIAAGSLSVVVDNSGNFSIYSNNDLGLTYTPAGPPAAVIKNVPISNADTSIMRAAIDVSTLRNVEGFIGTPKANFEIISSATSAGGDNAAANLYTQLTGQAAPTVSADGDSFAVLQVQIAGRTFQSVIWKEAAAADLDDRAFVFKEHGTSETFTVNTGTGGYNPNITVKAGGLAADLEGLFATSVFAQTRDLEIFTAGGQIIDETATVIGDVTGMTVSLNSTDFTNKNFEDFTITESAGGNIIFTATINKQKFVRELNVADMIEGAALKLNNDESGDVLTINIGKGGLSSLKNAKNYGIIEQAIKNSLMSIGIGLEVRTGIDLSEKTVVRIDDISTNKLYRDNRNVYVKDINLLDKHSTSVAMEVITNAQKLTRNTEDRVKSFIDHITNQSADLRSRQRLSQKSSDSYLNADIMKSASEFSEALQAMQSSIVSLQATEKTAKDIIDRLITPLAASSA